MDAKQLHEMQRWSLEDKVAHSIDVMSSFIARVGGIDKVYVSFSGGVDSLVMLHIARTFVNKEIKAVFCNTGIEWPELAKFVKTFDNVETIHPKKHIKEIFEAVGFPLVGKRVSSYIREVRHGNPECALTKKRLGNDKLYSIPLKWRFLLDKPYEASEKCCQYLKKEPFRHYERQTGRKPIIGYMASESLMRENDYIKRGGCNSFKPGKEQSSPMSIWLNKDVWEYIHHNNIKYCSIYDSLKDKRTGCVVCGYGLSKDECKFSELYDRYPKMYEWFMKLKNGGVEYRQALKDVGAVLPDEQKLLL